MAFYAFIIPVLISTAAGAVIAGAVLGALEGTGVLRKVQMQYGRAA